MFVNHTDFENGDMKENVDGGCCFGFKYRIEIPDVKRTFI